MNKITDRVRNFLGTLATSIRARHTSMLMDAVSKGNLMKCFERQKVRDHHAPDLPHPIHHIRLHHLQIPPHPSHHIDLLRSITSDPSHPTTTSDPSHSTHYIRPITSDLPYPIHHIQSITSDPPSLYRQVVRPRVSIRYACDGPRFRRTAALRHGGTKEGRK